MFNFLLGIAYAVLYDYVYKNYICEAFSYEISAKHDMSSYYVVYLIVAAVPLFYYKGIRHVASAMSLFLYIFAYVPIVNNIFSWGYSTGLVISYGLALFLSMCVFFQTDHLFILKGLMKRKKEFPIKYLEILTCLLFLFFLVSQRGNFHFVNFMEDSAEMYDLRADNSMGGNYLVAWLRSAFLPFFLVYYLAHKSYAKYTIAFIAYLMVYMVDMQKMTFIYPFVVTALVFMVRLYGEQFKTYFHATLIVLMIVLPLWLMNNLDDPLIYGVAAIFIMRTQCIEGMEMATYMKFFEIDHHPFTYYNHINVVNAVTHANPYPQSIGLAVTGGNGNANGVFWLMDGVAAMGVWGIIIIGVLFILVKAALNSLEIKVSAPLCVCILLNGIQGMVNASLFTALNSCGLIMIFLIFMFFDMKSMDKNILS